MSKTTGIIIAVVVVIVLGGAWYLYGGTVNPVSAPSGDTTQTQDKVVTLSNASSANDLQTLMTQGGNFTCSLTALTSGSNTSGTIYASAKNMRLDFSVSQNGTTVTTHTIRNGQTAYIWVDGQTTGTKANVPSTATLIPQPQGGTVSVNRDSNIASDCHPWVPDATQFEPPASIHFVAQ
jgi:hypothetical protein